MTILPQQAGMEIKGNRKGLRIMFNQQGRKGNHKGFKIMFNQEARKGNLKDSIMFLSRATSKFFATQSPPNSISLRFFSLS